ncbi:thioesterase domain-containing protein [Streptosporangium amethystogenes subsp. fukuiense]|uniref:thioesterase domain-containing protein n=1 Tax=Streptosporangium amethystogenes TaxID=2002 RepID=UPI003606F40D
MFCFTHAGGSARLPGLGRASYRSVELHATQLHRQGGRFGGDPSPEDMDTLADLVTEAMSPLLDRPAAARVSRCVGHSMGATLATLGHAPPGGQGTRRRRGASGVGAAPHESPGEARDLGVRRRPPRRRAGQPRRYRVGRSSPTGDARDRLPYIRADFRWSRLPPSPGARCTPDLRPSSATRTGGQPRPRPSRGRPCDESPTSLSRSSRRRYFYLQPQARVSVVGRDHPLLAG